ncbi:MAG: hypothetical protein Q7R95_10640 [bacterium]|nr:hypothetical protein [bacterium]
MKIKPYKHLKNKSKTFSIYFAPSWRNKKKSHFNIGIGDVRLQLGGREAKMLHRFLNKVF